MNIIDLNLLLGSSTSLSNPKLELFQSWCKFFLRVIWHPDEKLLSRILIIRVCIAASFFSPCSRFCFSFLFVSFLFFYFLSSFFLGCPRGGGGKCVVEVHFTGQKSEATKETFGG